MSTHHQTFRPPAGHTDAMRSACPYHRAAYVSWRNCGSWAKGHCENIKTFYYLCGLIIFFFVLGCAGSCVFCINRGKDTSSSCSADTCTDTCTGASLARLPRSAEADDWSLRSSLSL